MELICGLAALMLISGSKSTKPVIVAASLFKNGYAVVTRSIDVTGGQAVVEEIPQGSLGTVWFQTTDGLKIESLKNTEVETSAQVGLTSIDQLLHQNVGKTMTILAAGDKSFTGKLIAADGSLVVIETALGQVALNEGNISQVTVQSGLKLDTAVSKKHRVLEIKLSGTASGKLYMIGLEKGLTWSPSYSLDVTDPKKLKVTEKAIIINDLDPFSNVEARLVTGFPNVLFGGITDPLLAQASLDVYVQEIGAKDAQMDAERNNLFANTANRGMMSQSAGGFAAGDFSTSMAASRLPGEQEADLFFYRQPAVTMAKGDRAYYILASGSLDYKEVYTWDSYDPISNNVEYQQANQAEPVEEVWHSLDFNDKLDVPLTTGPATTFKGGELIGQDILKYTSRGAKTTVKITKAIDVQAETADEEVSRERGALKVYNNPVYDLVTLKTTLRVDNHKTEKINLRISKPYTGEITASDGAKVTKTSKGLRQVNTSGKLVWEREVLAGKSVTIVYTSKVYVRSNGM